ncbi:MAG: hypothetical protein ACHQZR_06310 [Candidatus Limnocylindrales bacterium]
MTDTPPGLLVPDVPSESPDMVGARADISAARVDLGSELDALEATVRASVSPANLLRNNAGKLAAGAGAAGFVALGGPSRILKGARRVLGGRRPSPVESLLPKEIDDAVSRLGPDAPAVRANLERAFAEYLRGRKTDESAAAARLWRFVDAIAVPVGARVVRQAVDRFLAPKDDQP